MLHFIMIKVNAQREERRQKIHFNMIGNTFKNWVCLYCYWTSIDWREKKKFGCILFTQDNCLISIRVNWPFTWLISLWKWKKRKKWTEKKKKLINSKLTCWRSLNILMTSYGQVHTKMAIKTRNFRNQKRVLNNLTA